MTDAVEIGLGSILATRASISAAEPALTFEGRTLTYGAFAGRVRRLAQGLRDLGVCRGDRVGYLGFNHPAFLETLYAAASIGAVFVPINFRLTGPELEYIVNDAGVHSLIVDDRLADTVGAIADTIVCRQLITAESGRSGWHSLDGLIERSCDLPVVESVGSDDVAIIMYTSGTTGRPKGAMLTHGNLFWNDVNLGLTGAIDAPVSLTCAPLFHIGGLNVTTLGSIARGAHIILEREFDPGQVLADLQTYRVGTLFGVPAMFLFISQHPDFQHADLSHLKTLVAGGAPVPEPQIRLFMDRGVNFLQGYGLTETAPMALLLPAGSARDKVGSAGLPPMYTQVKVAGEQGEPLGPGEKGEICIRGPNVMRGYWNRPEATAEALDTEGWFHSGDIGYRDEDGFFYICDRVKDMVISGGENVYPAEVESVIYAHPAVAEVAVIGLPDEKWGEAVAAVVALKPGQTLELEALREFAGASLARYKLPRQLHTVDELPRNPAGKVLKYRLREALAGD
jgi:fatty-acyl-CoA synthase